MNNKRPIDRVVQLSPQSSALYDAERAKRITETARKALRRIVRLAPGVVADVAREALKQMER